MSMAVLFFVLAALDKKDLQPKIRILDVAFLFFTFLIFASHFWAEYPSLIWTKSFHWLLLAVSYLIARNIDAKQFDTTQCLRGFLTVNIINYLFLVVVYFAIASSEGKMKLSYFGLQNIHLYYATNANYIATLFVVLFPIYFLVLKKRVIRRDLTFVLMCVHITLLLTFNSKGAIIALIASSFLAIFQLQSTMRRKALLVTAAILSTSLLIVFATISNPVNFLNQMGPKKMMPGSPTEERIQIWHQGFEIFADHPILGAGAGNWPVEFLKLGVSDFNFSYDSPNYYKHAHNLIVEVAGELGATGVLIMLFIFAYPFISWVRNPQNKLVWSLPVILAYIICAQFYGVSYGAITNFHPAQFLCIFLIAFWANGSRVIWGLQNIKSANLLMFFASMSLIWSIYLDKKRILYAEIGNLRGKGEIEKAILKTQELYDPNLYRHKGLFPIKGQEGFLKLRSGEIDQALTLFEQALKDNPYAYDILYHTGRLFLHKKEIQKAKQFLERAYSINSTYYPTSIALARISLIENDAEGFNDYLSFYDEWIIPLKDKHYSEDVWDSNSAVQIALWKRVCTYEEQVIMLRENWKSRHRRK